MRVKWTRDEAILALDVFFSSRDKSFSMNNPEIIELSELLNRLPVVPFNKRSDTFRNVAGVRRQIVTFEWSIRKSVTSRVGEMFYVVYEEFKTCPEKLHKIAQAIRRCINVAKSICFADETEVEGFNEGALLAHLHRYLETKFGVPHIQIERCYICSIKPQHIYKDARMDEFLEAHLIIPPEDYGPDLKLKKIDFVTVCPNCHKALHRVRPWVDAANLESILY